MDFNWLSTTLMYKNKNIHGQNSRYQTIYINQLVRKYQHSIKVVNN